MSEFDDKRLTRYDHEALGHWADQGASPEALDSMDRTMAFFELQSKFDIVAPGQERNANDVSAEEYQRIVQTYSDIRRGKGDIWLNPYAHDWNKHFAADAMNDIAAIMQTESGRDLIYELQDNVMIGKDGKPAHREVAISPNVDNDGAPQNNARNIGAMTPGEQVPFPDGRSGVGDNTTVLYNPGVDVVTPHMTSRSDVTLYHELVHALHRTQGTLDAGEVLANDGVARELAQADFAGASEEARNPDVNVWLDALWLDRGPKFGPVDRAEHQATGLGYYEDARFSENRYRGERNDLAFSGEGVAGDWPMLPRRRYDEGD